MPRLNTWGRLAAALALAIAACDAASTSIPGDGDAGLEGGELGRAACPSAAPAAGAACTLPQGTTCAFGTCGAGLARCDRGTWIYGENPPPSPPCPAAPPAPDDPCPVCWPGGQCTYFAESCSDPDASLDGAAPNTAVASCQNDRWQVVFRPCLDAGADVQRDGGPDAD